MPKVEIFFGTMACVIKTISSIFVCADLALFKGKVTKMASKTSAPSTTRSPMTAAAAARIQSATAKATGGVVAKGSFAARAQSTVAKSGK